MIPKHDSTRMWWFVVFHLKHCQV